VSEPQRTRLWKILAVLSPLAAILGMLLAYRHSTPAHLGLAVTRREVVGIARAQAASRGLNTDGWTDLVAFQPDNSLRHYLDVTATPSERTAIERVLAPIPYRAMLENPKHPLDSVRITVAPGGRLITYRVPPNGRAAIASDADARTAADAELQRRLGADRAEFAFAGAGVQRHETTSTDIRRFTYRRKYSNVFSIEAVVETSGAQPIAFTVAPKLAPEYTQRFPELNTTLRTVRGGTILLCVVLGLIYVITRFVRRLREHEIPLARTATVAALVAVAFFSSTLITGVSQRMDALEKGTAAPAGIQFAIMLVLSAIMGAMVGLTWGACEADLRETAPEKLISTDALLGRRFSSRVVRRSLAIGLIAAAYSALLSGIEPLLRLPHSWAAASEELSPYQTTYPALTLTFYAFFGLPATIAMLLTAISAISRLGRTRRVQLALSVLVFVFFVLVTLGNHAPLAWSLVTAALTTTALLLPLFVGDVLAVIVSIVFGLWFVSAPALIAQPSASLRASGWALLVSFLAVIVAGSLMAMRKRSADEDAETDRPEYARNIAERIMLHSEMDAARQAQLRVMPHVVPVVEGTQLAARHSESAELGGDYFEFFPTPTHVSVAVADARLPGLSSALCVSMLKGLLLNYAARLHDPRDVADRVHRQLSSIFGDDLPLSFFFGRLDLATGAFSFATFGSAPRAVIVRDGRVTPLEGEELIELQPSDALLIYTARLADLHSRDGITIGDAALHHELSTTGSASAPQSLVDALFELASRHVRGVGTPQSWAAVAMARSTS
jgi:MFS family permease